MLNQMGLFEEEEMSSQMGFYPFTSNFISTSASTSFLCHQTLKSITIPSNNITPSSTLTHDTLLSASTPKQLLSLQRAWGEMNMQCMSNKRSESGGGGGGGGGGEKHIGGGLGVCAMKMKKMKGRRKVREPRFCFKTMSDVDVLDDGYKWRKYGQKVVKNTHHPRSYYRCTQDNCRVKKRVERLAEDPRMVITTYEGRHAHSPSLDLDDSQAPSDASTFLW